MSRIRYLKPEFFKDEDLATLDFKVRLFYQGLWNFADKAGRLEERPMRLKAEIFPYDKVDVNKCLDLLSKPKNGSGRPFIQRYSDNGLKLIQILSWDKHQKPHHKEPESILPPAPPTITIKGTITIKEHDRSGTSNHGDNTVETPSLKYFKEKHLDFVLLTTEELKKLINRFGGPDTEKRIERLNNYLGSTGKKYRSHYHTILCWASKENFSIKKDEYPETIQKALNEVRNATSTRKPL
mgnify:CR=1 FL=1